MNSLQHYETQILLVEDDEIDAMLLQRTLSECDDTYQLHVCSTLGSAISWLEEHGCDVVLLDFSLPDSFGLDSLRTIHKRFPDLPIVMLSGLDDQTVAIDARESGARDYLVKGSVDADALNDTLQMSIGRGGINLQRPVRLLR